MAIDIRPSTLKKHAKRVKDRNYRFRKMTKSRQRVRIAKEVLDLLAARRINARSTYFDWSRGRDRDAFYKLRSESWEKKEKNVDMSLILPQVKCNVCGIGSVFVACIGLADKLKVEDFSDDRPEMVEYLRPYFSADTLEALEDAFEENIRYKQLHPLTPEDRLKALMNNIIKNKGKFKPEQFDTCNEYYWDQRECDCCCPDHCDCEKPDDAAQ